VEPLIERADQKCVASLNDGKPRTVRLVPPPEK
jgi:hypothetical protein